MWQNRLAGQNPILNSHRGGWHVDFLTFWIFGRVSGTKSPKMCISSFSKKMIAFQERNPAKRFISHFLESFPLRGIMIRTIESFSGACGGDSKGLVG